MTPTLPAPPIGPLTPHLYTPDGGAAAARQAAAPARRHARRSARPSLGPGRALGDRRGPRHRAARQLHRAAVAGGLDPARRRARGHRDRGRRAARRSTSHQPRSRCGPARSAAESARLAAVPGPRGLEPAARPRARSSTPRPTTRRAGARRARRSRASGASPPCSSTSCAARAPVRLGVDLPQEKRLRRLCEAVIEEPSRHATLAAWAADTGASARTLTRLFRSELGTSFVQWRQQVLLARAVPLAARKLPMASDRRRARLRQPERLRGDGPPLGRRAAEPLPARRATGR